MALTDQHATRIRAFIDNSGDLRKSLEKMIVINQITADAAFPNPTAQDLIDIGVGHVTPAKLGAALAAVVRILALSETDTNRIPLNQVRPGV